MSSSQSVPSSHVGGSAPTPACRKVRRCKKKNARKKQKRQLAAEQFRQQLADPEHQKQLALEQKQMEEQIAQWQRESEEAKRMKREADAKVEAMLRARGWAPPPVVQFSIPLPSHDIPSVKPDVSAADQPPSHAQQQQHEAQPSSQADGTQASSSASSSSSSSTTKSEVSPAATSSTPASQSDEKEPHKQGTIIHEDKRSEKEKYRDLVTQAQLIAQQALARIRTKSLSTPTVAHTPAHALTPSRDMLTPHRDGEQAERGKDFGTEKDKQYCPFFIKTGCCRFGSRCGRAHLPVSSSNTLLIRNMFVPPGMVSSGGGEEDVDSWLEVDDAEVQRSFEEFFFDVHPEFLRSGVIKNFKVCRNFAPHLRGNVYVQYFEEQSAHLAFSAFNGRFYAGKQISCEFVNVPSWKAAICGMSGSRRCPKGPQCNFLHPFRNPDGLYSWADRDQPPPRHLIDSVERDMKGGYRDKSRSRSRDRHSDRHRDISRSRRSDRGRERSRSRDRERDYERSRYDSRSTRRSRSRERDRRRSRSRSRDSSRNRRERGERWGDRGRRSRSSSRGREREKDRDSERRPGRDGRKDKKSDESRKRSRSRGRHTDRHSPGRSRHTRSRSRRREERTEAEESDERWDRDESSTLVEVQDKEGGEDAVVEAENEAERREKGGRRSSRTEESRKRSRSSRHSSSPRRAEKKTRTHRSPSGSGTREKAERSEVGRNRKEQAKEDESERGDRSQKDSDADAGTASGPDSKEPHKTEVITGNGSPSWP